MGASILMQWIGKGDFAITMIDIDPAKMQNEV